MACADGFVDIREKKNTVSLLMLITFDEHNQDERIERNRIQSAPAVKNLS